MSGQPQLGWSQGILGGHPVYSQAFELFWTHSLHCSAVSISFWQCHAACGILVPRRRIKPPRPVHWEYGVLAAGLPGKASAVSRAKLGRSCKLPALWLPGSLHSSGPGRKGGTRMSLEPRAFPQGRRQVGRGTGGPWSLQGPPGALSGTPRARKRPPWGNPSEAGWAWPTSLPGTHPEADGLCSRWGEGLAKAGSFWPQPLGFPLWG